MTAIPLPRGFERTEWPYPWAMTLRCRACQKTIDFVTPTEGRQQWYENSHRCSGRGWQGETP